MVSYAKAYGVVYYCGVLILVVMEDGLVHPDFDPSDSTQFCLNPCCNGRWSRTNLIMATVIVNNES